MAEIPFIVAGPENLVLGADDDAIVDNLATFNSTDSITGATGTQNVLAVLAAAPLSLVTGPAAFNGIRGIETIRLESSFAHVIVLDNSFVANNNLQGVLTVSAFVGATPITVDASALSSGNAVSFDGDGGNDTLRGGAGPDTFFGFDGNDSAVGGGGDDFLIGDRGDDILLGGVGDDFLAGESGDDTLDGGDGGDTISYAFATAGVVVDLGLGGAADGEGGVDLLLGIEFVEGSDFADLLVGNDDDNQIRGLGGVDTIVGGNGIDFAVYDFGDAPILGSIALGLVLAGEGDIDLLIGIEGLAGADLFGDQLLGSLGEDDLQGNGGDDILIGFESSDTLRGGNGDDRVYAAGDDGIAEGGVGSADVLVIGANATGLRQINLATTANQNASGSGPTVTGFEAVDASTATSGVTITGAIFDGIGNVLIGSAQSDSIAGSAGADVIMGGGGADTLLAGLGNDTIFADRGNDTVTGGDGADVFFYAGGAGAGAVRVADFAPGSDKIGLPTALGLTPAQADAQLVAAGADSVLQIAAGQSITFVGLSPAAISASDFQVF